MFLYLETILHERTVLAHQLTKKKIYLVKMYITVTKYVVCLQKDESQDVVERLRVSLMNGKSISKSAKSHTTKISVRRSREDLEAVNVV